MKNAMNACRDAGVPSGMSAKQEAYAKSLRQHIMISSKKQHNWSNEEFHDMLKSWGFGSSLRKLTIQQLQTVLRIVKGDENPKQKEVSPREKYGIGRFDKQGDYVWSLIQQVGWTNDRFRKFIGKHYQTVHWNALEPKERSGCIAMLKNYLKKVERNLSTNYTNYTKNKEGEKR
jgi:hypothetical protein